MLRNPRSGSSVISWNFLTMGGYVTVISCDARSRTLGITVAYKNTDYLAVGVHIPDIATRYLRSRFGSDLRLRKKDPTPCRENNVVDAR